MRPSLIVQYICFASLALCPWAVVLGADVKLMLGVAAAWLVLGFLAAWWHRRIEEA
jgi:hypothetical protein